VDHEGWVLDLRRVQVLVPAVDAEAVLKVHLQDTPQCATHSLASACSQLAAVRRQSGAASKWGSALDTIASLELLKRGIQLSKIGNIITSFPALNG
jgi:hypothetical protein